MEAWVTSLRGGTGGGAAPLSMIIFSDHSPRFAVFSRHCSLSHDNMPVDDLFDAGTIMTIKWD